MANLRKEITIQRNYRKSKINSSKIKLLIPKGNYFREFSSITSLHGIMYLGEPKRPLLERVFWFGVMSLVICLCGWQIYHLYSNWLSSKTIMTFDNNKYSIWDLPFPAITFCSDLQLHNINNRTYKDDVYNKEIEDSINLLCYQYESNKNVTLKVINSKNFNHVVQNYQVECQKRLIRLFWLQDEMQSPCDYFQPILTSYGICYSLNMIPHQHLCNKDYYESMSLSNHTQADIIAKKIETTWTPETGYSANATPFDTPWRVTSDTIDNAVRLVFNLHTTNIGGHYCPKTNSGLTLLLHNPADVPIGINPTAYVLGRRMLTISLSALILRTSSKIKNWTPEMRNCYYQHEKWLKFFKVYTLQNCENECRANNTLNKCGCNAFYQPRDPDASVCGTDKFECIKQSSSIGYSVFDKQLEPFNVMEDCQCLPACTAITYESKTVEFVKNWTTNSTNLKTLDEDAAVVIIYYKKKSVVDVRKTPLMPFNELLGNIGGLFGLFLGCSIISFFEILYFFVIRLYFDHRDQMRAKSKIMPNFILE